MNNLQKYLSTCLLATTALLVGAAPAWAQTAPSLGTAANFVVLGGAGVTCTDSTITGAVGSLLTVIPTATCTINGSIHEGDAVAIAANGDFLLAYDELAAKNTCPRLEASHNLSGDLRSGTQGSVLEPGVYCISGTGLLTGQLTLAGPRNAIWIFIAASDLTPIGGSVVMANGGQACNVYWQTGTAVDLDATDFLGNILAGSAITFSGVGSSLAGRALAKTAVTATGANITACTSGTNPPNPPSPPKQRCNQGVGNGPENCDPGNSNQGRGNASNPFAGSNDELGGTRGNPGRKGGNFK